MATYDLKSKFLTATLVAQWLASPVYPFIDVVNLIHINVQVLWLCVKIRSGIQV